MMEILTSAMHIQNTLIVKWPQLMKFQMTIAKKADEHNSKNVEWPQLKNDGRRRKIMNELKSLNTWMKMSSELAFHASF